MKKIIFFTIFLISATNEFAFANSKDCNELKKLSLEYFKCKGKIVKDKTISSGENISFASFIGFASIANNDFDIERKAPSLICKFKGICWVWCWMEISTCLQAKGISISAGCY